MTVTVEIPKMKIESRPISKKKHYKSVLASKSRSREFHYLEQQLKLANSRIELQEVLLTEYKETIRRQNDYGSTMARRNSDQQKVIQDQEGRIKSLIKDLIQEKLKVVSLQNNGQDTQDASTQTEEAQDYFKPAKRLFEEPFEFWNSSTEDFEEDYKLVI